MVGLGISEPSRVCLLASFNPLRDGEGRHPTFNGTRIRHPGCLKVQAYTCKSCNNSIHNSYRHCRMHTNFWKKLTHEAYMTLNPTPRTCWSRINRKLTHVQIYTCRTTGKTRSHAKTMEHPGEESWSHAKDGYCCKVSKSSNKNSSHLRPPIT